MFSTPYFSCDGIQRMRKKSRPSTLHMRMTLKDQGDENLNIVHDHTPGVGDAADPVVNGDIDIEEDIQEATWKRGVTENGVPPSGNTRAVVG